MIKKGLRKLGARVCFALALRLEVVLRRWPWLDERWHPYQGLFLRAARLDREYEVWPRPKLNH